ncbi:MAG: asparagine synthase-related protein [Novosphingobium sp.]
MGDFLAVLWLRTAEPEIATRSIVSARELRMDIAIRTLGMLVAVHDTRTCMLDGTLGALVGELHFRHGPAGAFDHSAEEIARLTGFCRQDEHLDNCWGSFLLFHRSSPDGELRIHHSPFSTLCAYYVATPQAVVIASDARILSKVTGIPTSINWRTVASQLAFDNLNLRDTCLSDVQELRAGETILLRPDNAPQVRLTWNPWTFSDPGQSILVDDDAIELVERELLRCVAARTAAHSSAMLDLSGGLDSSILAATCRRVGAAPRAVNLFSALSEGDERGYARAVAEHLGIGLSEAAAQAASVDIERCASPGLARPHARSFVQEADRLTRAAAPDATSFINGGGGDAVFCHLQSSAPAVDALRSAQADIGFLKAVHEVAAAAHCSFWVALRMASVKSFSRLDGVRLVADPGFLLPEGIVAPADDALPWPGPPRGIPPGKREQVRALYSSIFNVAGFARSQDLTPVFPLLSQPLVEACLRVPSWKWVRQGHNRFLARRIAEKWLPRSVAWRGSKGGLGQLQREIFRINRKTIREMLLNGALQKQGLVDRAQLEAHLAISSDLVSDKHARLLRLCDFEAWIRHWH